MIKEDESVKLKRRLTTIYSKEIKSSVITMMSNSGSATKASVSGSSNEIGSALKTSKIIEENETDTNKRLINDFEVSNEQVIGQNHGNYQKNTNPFDLENEFEDKQLFLLSQKIDNGIDEHLIQNGTNQALEELINRPLRRHLSTEVFKSVENNVKNANNETTNNKDLDSENNELSEIKETCENIDTAENLEEFDQKTDITLVKERNISNSEETKHMSLEQEEQEKQEQISHEDDIINERSIRFIQKNELKYDCGYRHESLEKLSASQLISEESLISSSFISSSSNMSYNHLVGDNFNNKEETCNLVNDNNNSSNHSSINPQHNNFLSAVKKIFNKVISNDRDIKHELNDIKNSAKMFEMHLKLMAHKKVENLVISFNNSIFWTIKCTIQKISEKILGFYSIYRIIMTSKNLIFSNYEDINTMLKNENHNILDWTLKYIFIYTKFNCDNTVYTVIEQYFSLILVATITLVNIRSFLNLILFIYTVSFKNYKARISRFLQCLILSYVVGLLYVCSSISMIFGLPITYRTGLVKIYGDMDYSLLKFYADKSFIYSIIFSALGEFLYMGYTTFKFLKISTSV